MTRIQCLTIRANRVYCLIRLFRVPPHYHARVYPHGRVFIFMTPHATELFHGLNGEKLVAYAWVVSLGLLILP